MIYKVGSCGDLQSRLYAVVITCSETRLLMNWLRTFVSLDSSSELGLYRCEVDDWAAAYLERLVCTVTSLMVLLSDDFAPLWR